MNELSNTVALVTGSSSGIGEACARRLAEMGAKVMVNSASSVEAGQQIAQEIGGAYRQADISDAEQSRGLVEATIGQFGQIDVLVNNAGWTSFVDHADLEGLTDEIFSKTFDVNVHGTWHVTKAAIPHLANSQDGSVATITSVAGVRPVGSSIAYSMSKAALNHMTVLLAKSYGPIRFNAVAPGLIATPWTEDWTEMHEFVASKAPVQSSGSPDHVASVVAMLATNPYLTGETIVVDGGLTQVM